MSRQLTQSEVEQYAEAVRTGSPEVALLACLRCGVLLWDIGRHYDHAHPGEGPR